MAMRAQLLLLGLLAAAGRAGGAGDSSAAFSCAASEPWVGPFSYGGEPVPQQRCLARGVQLSRCVALAPPHPSRPCGLPRPPRPLLTPRLAGAGDSSTGSPAMHVYVADAQERERLRREWGSSATAIRLHMHVVDLPLLVHDAPLPRCSRHISRALAFSVPDLANLYREAAAQPTHVSCGVA